MRLQYRSLITKENIEYCLSIIEDVSTKRDLIRTSSKIDIRISTTPVIEGKEFYYKIWVIRRGTKKKAHIKQYYSIKLLKKKMTKATSCSSDSPYHTLAEVFDMVKITADVPDDFEEYCEMWFRDPSDTICRFEYLQDLKRAERFKKFLTKEEIRSIPNLPNDYTNNKIIKDKDIKILDLTDESNLKLLNYSIIYLSDKREYDKLAELKDTLEYHAKIVEAYGYDTYTGIYDENKFPITKEDKQMDNIAKDFKNYFKMVKEYEDYLKELIKKYNIKQTGNTIRRIAFSIIIRTTSTESISKYPFITTVLDSTFF